MNFLISQRLKYTLFGSVTSALLVSKDQACLKACGQGGKASRVDLSLLAKVVVVELKRVVRRSPFQMVHYLSTEGMGVDKGRRS